MHELSACVEWLFADVAPAFDDRVRAAVDAGVPAVEFWRWRDKDLPALRAAVRESGAAVTSFVSDPSAQLVDPATHEAFLAGLRESCALAGDLGAGALVVLAGDRRPGVDDRTQRDAVVAALSEAAPVAERHGVVLVLEPLNTRVDHPGHFLATTPAGLDVVRAVASSHVRLLYDAYHSAVMDEDVSEVLDGAWDLVGHMQVADTPGRHEPGTGRVDWSAVLRAARTGGYTGRIGLEYVPATSTTASLQHVREVAA